MAYVQLSDSPIVPITAEEIDLQFSYAVEEHCKMSIFHSVPINILGKRIFPDTENSTYLNACDKQHTNRENIMLEN